MLNFFVVPNGDGSYALSIRGYMAAAIIVFLILILSSMLTDSKKRIDTRELTFAAVAIALTLVTSFIKLWHMPMGGSITLFSMLFITLIGYWYGPSFGILTGVAYGMLQLIIDPYILSLPQMLIDYPLSFGALGISGFFANRKHGMVLGYLAGVAGRYFFAVISGVVFFGMYAADFGMSPLPYSLAYNGLYIGGEALITVVVLLIPAVSKALAHLKVQTLA
ncbi:energy-coupled thiamine transporter ThiT [Eubacterium barkeri]|uniref:Thiamine transporter n=1 Tax=Eubacterium barkeri TaxID=1528 RepID=A0A1H3CIR3_EUBBA|nr:energy-coupled thiamine transporter ThiT [Eubacterium barkeri]SDX54005.1 thiamine transporter [Eubacterium barkeri]